MKLSKEHRQEIEAATTRELVAIHNVYTMSERCIRIGDDRRDRLVLDTVHKELERRGVTAVKGRLIDVIRGG